LEQKRNYLKGGRRNWQIAFMDETEFWSDEITDLLPDGAKIYGVYFFDPGIIVHCCSFSGSIECWPLGSIVYGGKHESWEAMSDEDREKLLDAVDCDRGDDVRYFADGSLKIVVDSHERVLRTGSQRETNWEYVEEALREAQSTNGYLDTVLYQQLAAL
jgi:hypothetical protein